MHGHLLSGQISRLRRLSLMKVTRAAPPLCPSPPSLPPPTPPSPPSPLRSMASLAPHPHNSRQMDSVATTPKAFLARRRRRILVVTVLMASWLIGSGSRVLASSSSQLQQQTILQQQQRIHRRIDDRRMSPFNAEVNGQLVASESSAGLTKSPDDDLTVDVDGPLSIATGDSVQQTDASGHNSHSSSSTAGATDRHVIRRRRRHVMHRFPVALLPPLKRNSVSWLIAATLRTCKDSFGECLRQRRLQYSIRTHQMEMAMKSKVVA